VCYEEDDAKDVARVLIQAEQVQHELGDKFDRLSETAKNGMQSCQFTGNFVNLPVI